MQQMRYVLKADNHVGRVLYIGPDQILMSLIDSHLTEVFKKEFKFESLTISFGKALVNKTIRDAANNCLIGAAAMMGDSSDVVGYSMALRLSKPDLPTILRSADVSMSEFSTDRWEICN